MTAEGALRIGAPRWSIAASSIGILAIAILSGCDGGMRLELGRRGLTQAVVAPPVTKSPSAELPAPPGLRATSGQLRAVPLTWDPLLVGDVGGYVIERSLEEGGAFTRLAIVQGRLETLYLDLADDDSGPLGDGVTAWYRLRAYTADGRLGRELTPVVEATTAPPPAAPADLRAFSLQPRVVPLSWRASEDPTVAGYVVYRSPAWRGPYEPIAWQTSRDETAYVDRGLGELRVFYYRVAARNLAGGEGPPSEPVRAVTKPEPLPPIGLRVTGALLGRNALTWEPNVERDLAGYRLLRHREGDDAPEVVGLVGSEATEAVDGEVGDGERVVYTLVAVDRDGLDSEPSLPLMVESQAYGLTATLGEDGVELAWNARAEEGYVSARILRGGRFSHREIGSVGGDRFVDAEVRSGGPYRYSVVLERADGTEAPPSRPLEITIPAD